MPDPGDRDRNATAPPSGETPRLGAALERVAGTPIDVSRIERLGRRVCLVRQGRRVMGTAFLVGPDLVMTNHHVAAEVLGGLVSEAELSFDFDEGVVVRLASSDWNIDSSPASEVDSLPDPKPREPSADELDFALLRLERAVGRESTADGPRGWLALEAEPHPFESGRPLLILQHPGGSPLSLAIDNEGRAEVNEPRTRVRYLIPTREGSSGSPVLDATTFHLVALHHASDPTHSGGYKQGVPIDRIAARTKVAAAVPHERPPSAPPAKREKHPPVPSEARTRFAVVLAGAALMLVPAIVSGGVISYHDGLARVVAATLGTAATVIGGLVSLQRKRTLESAGWTDAARAGLEAIALRGWAPTLAFAISMGLLGGLAVRLGMMSIQYYTCGCDAGYTLEWTSLWVFRTSESCTDSRVLAHWAPEGRDRHAGTFHCLRSDAPRMPARVSEAGPACRRADADAGTDAGLTRDADAGVPRADASLGSVGIDAALDSSVTSDAGLDAGADAGRREPCRGVRINGGSVRRGVTRCPSDCEQIHAAHYRDEETRCLVVMECFVCPTD